MNDTDADTVPQTSIVEKVRTAIVTLDSELATSENCLEAMNFAKRLREVAKELSDQVEQNVIAWIKLNGEIVDGTVRYYVGTNTTIKCTSVKEALEAVLEASGGDMDAVVACMSTGTWKHGACEKLLPPEVYAKLFVSREDDEIKEGKPKKLIKFDEKYVR